MAESKLRELSMEFSVDIINLVKYLKNNHESVIANQIGRSGTSIGENIHEAQYAQGKKDFISKLEIVLKEASKIRPCLRAAKLSEIHRRTTMRRLRSGAHSAQSDFPNPPALRLKVCYNTFDASSR